MGISVQEINYAIALSRTIPKFPGLDNNNESVKFLVNNKHIIEDLFDEAILNGENVETNSGLHHDTIIKSAPHYRNLEQYFTQLQIAVKYLLEDKELMKKEPFLGSYLELYKSVLDRAVSDKPEAEDIYNENTMGIAAVLLDTFNMNMPTTSDYNKLDDNGRKVADAIMAYMKAFSEYANFAEFGDKAMEKDPAKFKDENYKKALIEKVEKLKEATVNLGKITKDEMKQFCRNTKNTDKIDTALDDLYDNKKHDFSVAIEQLDNKIKYMNKGFSDEEIKLFENFSARIEDTIKSCEGAGSGIEYLLEGVRKDIALDMKRLGEQCKEKLEQGFDSPEEKRAFILNVANVIKHYDELYDSDKMDVSKLDENQSRAYEMICKRFATDTLKKTGPMYQFMKAGESIEIQEKALKKDFKQNFAGFCKMFTETGVGYKFHKNSKEYNDLYKNVKNLAKLLALDPPSEMQRKAISDSFDKISKSARKYLTEQKMGIKKTEVGENRFEAALGILKMVDPVNAEMVRERAEGIRGVSIKFEDLEARMREKTKMNGKAQDKKVNEKKAAAPKKSL